MERCECAVGGTASLECPTPAAAPHCSRVVGAVGPPGLLQSPARLLARPLAYESLASACLQQTSRAALLEAAPGASALPSNFWSSLCSADAGGMVQRHQR